MCRVTIYSLDVLLSNIESVLCSTSSPNCCFLIRIQVSQEASKIVSYAHLFKNFPQFVVIHIVIGFSIDNEAEVDVFWNSLAFSIIQWMLAVWSLNSLLFLNPACTSESSRITYCWSPAWTSGSSQSTYCWSFAWRILTITLLECEISAIVQ